MNKTTITVIIVVIVILGGYFLLNGSDSPQVQLPESDETPADTAEATNVVRYTESGYEPSTLTVGVGESVTFMNESGQSMWTASAAHPTHMIYDGTSLWEHCPNTAGTAFDQCSAGDEYSFTFTESGEWGYHNHLNPSHFGSIVVE